MTETRDGAVRALYGAAMGLTSWSDALDGLAHYTQTRCITLDTYDLSAQAGEVLASNMAPHPAIVEYNRTHGQRNLLIEKAYGLRSPDNAFRASQFVPFREFEKTELFNSVYRAMAIRFVAGIPLQAGSDAIAQCSIIRPDDAPDFSDDDLRLLSRIAPHLRQAWMGYQHVERLQSSLRTVTSLWDRFNHAVWVIDPDRRIKFANRAAEAILSAGRHWSGRGGKLRALDLVADRRLQAHLMLVLQGDQAMRRLGSADFGGDCVASLIRIESDRLALIVSDPTRSSNDLCQGLMVRFGLTRTEAAIVDALLAGEALRTIADERKIRYETARAHLKNAMRKNGWRRQGEMISEVLRVLLPADVFRA